MANRSYLYSTNYVPGSVATEVPRAVGIAEWSYDVPIVFKLLISGNPRTCQSLIFDGSDEIALVGDYDQGVAHMLRFLDRVSHLHPAVMELKDEAEKFFATENCKNPFFILEAGEVFQMVAESLTEETQKLLTELSDLEPQIANAIATIEARIWEESHPPGFIARLFGARTPARKDGSADLIYALGLGGWTNVLFYDPKIA